MPRPQRRGLAPGSVRARSAWREPIEQLFSLRECGLLRIAIAKLGVASAQSGADSGACLLSSRTPS